MQVLILDEHHIKKREAHIKLLQKALVITLMDEWKQQSGDQGILHFLYISERAHYYSHDS